MSKQSKNPARKSIVIRMPEQDKTVLENVAKFYGVGTSEYCRQSVVNYTNMILEALNKDETKIDTLLKVISKKQAELLLERLPEEIKKFETKEKEGETDGKGNEQGTESATNGEEANESQS